MSNFMSDFMSNFTFGPKDGDFFYNKDFDYNNDGEEDFFETYIEERVMDEMYNKNISYDEARWNVETGKDGW